MDSTDVQGKSQPDALPSWFVTQIEYLFRLVEMIRAWWAEFEEAIRAAGRDAATKGYDLFTDAAAQSRSIARTLGLEPVDPETIDWRVSQRPAGAVADL